MSGCHPTYGEEQGSSTVEQSAFRGKRVVILGLARQGLALARFMVAAGADVTVSDAAPAAKLAAELEKLGDLPVRLVLGEHPLSLLDGCDLLCLSGGVPAQLPVVQSAIAAKIPLSNDSLLTLQLAAQRGLGPIVAITGSSGKTTTTTLTGLMLATSGRKTHVGGNIGLPLIDRLDAIHPGEPIVLELSSFQLELFDPALAWGALDRLPLDVAAILNITPNHLDRHANMRAYADAKFNLLRRLPPGATAVLGADDAVTGAVLGSVPVAEDPGQRARLAAWNLQDLTAELHQQLVSRLAQVLAFSRSDVCAGGGAWLEGSGPSAALVYRGQTVCERGEVKLRGEHNISNLLAAMTISGAAGATVAAMGETARTFTGVPHRLEIVAENGGVTWINDSIATSPERALAGLRGFGRDGGSLILLAGGKDKNLPWEALAEEVLDRVDLLIGFGQAGPMIVEKVQEQARFAQRRSPNSAITRRLDEAVELAARAAEPGAVVLLSPGGTSYDAYKDFEERGEHFRRLVQQAAKG
jgi:UDP-N-acetylmuramoylalanine--D-glutamate ligase